MCFYSGGYHHTRSVPKYLTRLFLSHLSPTSHSSTFSTANLPSFHSAYCTPLPSVCQRYIYGIDCRTPVAPSANHCYCGPITSGDWMCFGIGFVSFPYLPPQLQPAGGGHFYIALVFAFPSFRQFNNRSKLAVSAARQRLSTGSNSQYSLLALYNGERGGSKYSKWIFYWFYPAHLLILGFLIHAV